MDNDNGVRARLRARLATHEISAPWKHPQSAKVEGDDFIAMVLEAELPDLVDGLPETEGS